MITRTQSRSYSHLKSLALAVVFSGGVLSMQPAEAFQRETDGNAPAVKAVDSGQKWAANEREAKLREILSRQRGKQLKVYLNSRSTYVNGKSVSSGQLTDIVKRSKLTEAVISAENYVTQKRVDQVSKTLTDAGIRKVAEVVIKRDHAAEREAKLRSILSRQKGDTLKVYLNARGTYVNGKSIRLADLKVVAERSRLQQAAVTVESNVVKSRIDKVASSLKSAGFKSVDQTERKRD